jgi:hypothetical protein
MTKYDQFLNCVTVAELKAIKNQPKKQFTLQTSNGQIINTEERFLDAVYHSLPLPSPPFSLPPSGIRLNRDALGDTMFMSFHALNRDEVDIIWPFADDVSTSSMFFLVKIVKFLKRVADQLSSYSYDDSGKIYKVRIRLFLVCSNEKNRNALEKEFWFIE